MLSIYRDTLSLLLDDDAISLRWFSSNSEVEGTWISLIGWPQKTSKLQKDNWISGITPMLSIYCDTLPLLLDDEAISLRRCQQKPPPFEVSFSLVQLVEFFFFIMIGK